MDDTISLDDAHTVPTRYWHSLEDGRVQCDVCPRACRLHEGQRGLVSSGAAWTTRSS
jgi:pyruvate formate lyase activating enzyme